MSQDKIFKNEISKRLNAFREGLGLKQVEFAHKIGDTQVNVSRYESGTEPKFGYIEKIAKVYGEKVMFLLTGQAPPAKPVQAPEIVFQTGRNGRTMSDPSDLYAAIPLLHDAVAAGAPAEIDESDWDDWAIIYKDRTWMPHGPENYTCARIRGRSMWPVLDDGDIVAIDHVERPREESDLKRFNGKMVAFRIDGGVTVKWLQYLADQELVVGVPENKDQFDHLIALRGEAIYDGIVGLVRWWWAKR